MTMQNKGFDFEHLAGKCSRFVGSPQAFVIALLVVIVWAVSGPLFDYSDTWELVINTATTIITFLMVFLIQNTQNRDAKALHLKVDELIYSIKKANNELIDCERMSIHELDELAKKYAGYHEHVTAVRVRKHGRA